MNSSKKKKQILQLLVSSVLLGLATLTLAGTPPCCLLVRVVLWLNIGDHLEFTSSAENRKKNKRNPPKKVSPQIW